MLSVSALLATPWVLMQHSGLPSDMEVVCRLWHSSVDSMSFSPTSWMSLERVPQRSCTTLLYVHIIQKVTITFLPLAQKVCLHSCAGCGETGSVGTALPRTTPSLRHGIQMLRSNLMFLSAAVQKDLSGFSKITYTREMTNGRATASPVFMS